MCTVSVGVCHLSDTVKKPLSTNVAIPMVADRKRGEGREESWPTVFSSVIFKLYGSGLVSITLRWISFK